MFYFLYYFYGLLGVGFVKWLYFGIDWFGCWIYGVSRFLDRFYYWFDVGSYYDDVVYVVFVMFVVSYYFVMSILLIKIRCNFYGLCLYFYVGWSVVLILFLFGCNFRVLYRVCWLVFVILMCIFLVIFFFILMKLGEIFFVLVCR